MRLRQVRRNAGSSLRARIRRLLWECGSVVVALSASLQLARELALVHQQMKWMLVVVALSPMAESRR